MKNPGRFVGLKSLSYTLLGKAALMLGLPFHITSHPTRGISDEKKILKH